MTAIVPDALQERVDVGFHGGNLFTEVCEWSSRQFTEACDTRNLRKIHNAAMKDDLHERRLKAFLDAQSELERAGKIESLNDWCTRAGLTWSTIGEFMAGRTRVMSDRTYGKLADAVGWSVARLKGEPEPTTLDPLEAEYFSMFRTLSKEEKRKEIKALRARLADDDQQ